jgi:hypothetical protein
MLFYFIVLKNPENFENIKRKKNKADDKINLQLPFYLLIYKLQVSLDLRGRLGQ